MLKYVSGMSEDHFPSFKQDHSFDFVPPGIEVAHVLWSAVCETHGVRLVHLNTGQYEEPVDGV
jgi:hypothetical protein